MPQGRLDPYEQICSKESVAYAYKGAGGHWLNGWQDMNSMHNLQQDVRGLDVSIGYFSERQREIQRTMPRYSAHTWCEAARDGNTSRA